MKIKDFQWTHEQSHSQFFQSKNVILKSAICVEKQICVENYFPTFLKSANYTVAVQDALM